MKNKIIHFNKERIIIIVVGVLVLLGGAIYRFSPGINSFSMPVTGKIKLIKKYQNRAVTLSSLEEKQIFLAAHTEKLSTHLISAVSNELAGVAVQNMLREMASLEKIIYKSIKTLKVDAKSFQYVSIVPVEIVFQAKIGQLKNLIYLIETSSKLLLIPELRVIKPGAKNKDDLNIIMTVYGFLNKKGK